MNPRLDSEGAEINEFLNGNKHEEKNLFLKGCFLAVYEEKLGLTFIPEVNFGLWQL